MREAWRSMCPNLPLPERFDIVLIVDALSNLADPMAALVSVQQHTSGAVLVQMGLPGVSEMLVSASQCSVTGTFINTLYVPYIRDFKCPEVEHMLQFLCDLIDPALSMYAKRCIPVPCALAGRPDELPVTMEFSGDILQAARISGFSNASRSGDSIFVLVP